MQLSEIMIVFNLFQYKYIFKKNLTVPFFEELEEKT